MNAPPRVLVLAGAPIVRAGLASLLGERAELVVVGGDAPPGATRVRPEGADPASGADEPGPADVVLWSVEPGNESEALATLAEAEEGSDAGRDGRGPLVAVAGHVATSDGTLPPVVLLVDPRQPPGFPLAALRAGARGVLPATALADEIAAALVAAAAGLVVLPRRSAEPLLRDGAPGAERGEDGRRGGRPGGSLPDGAPGARTGATLTPRERDVLALLAEGMANKAIAPRLGISEHTVKAHVAAIFEKLGAGTRAEAVVVAARQGLLML